MANDILTLPDGTRVRSNGEIVNEEVKEPRAFQIIRNRDIAELPADGRAFALLVSLELFGLSRGSIAEYLDKSLEQITSIMNSKEYIAFRDEVIDGALEVETGDVRKTFVAHSAKAAKKMVKLLDATNPEAQAFAMKEVLDRAGFRPVDIVEHRIKHENDLRIVYVEDTKPKQTIDADFVELK